MDFPEYDSPFNGTPVSLPENPGYTSIFSNNLFNQTPVYAPPAQPVNFQTKIEGCENSPIQVFEKKPDYLLITKVFSGGALLHEYKKYGDSITDNELIVLYEDVTEGKSNLFGDFCLVRFGNKFKTLLQSYISGKKLNVNGNDKKNETAYKLEKIDDFLAYVKIMFANSFNIQIDTQTLLNSIRVELNLNHGQEVTIGNVTIEGIAIGFAKEKIKNWKFDTKAYQPEEDGYDPLLPINQLRKIADSAFEESDEEGGLNIGAIFNAASSIFDFVGTILEDSNNPLKKFAKFFNEVAQWFEDVKQLLKEIASKLIDILEVVNAFLVGLLNGLLSLIELILDLLALVYGDAKVETADPGDAYNRTKQTLEGIEDLLDVFSENFQPIINAFKQCFSDFSKEALSALLSSIAKLFGFSEYNKYDWAYFAGAFVFEVLFGLFIGFLTGGASVAAQAGSKLTKLAGAIRAFAVEAFHTATAGIFQIIPVLRLLIINLIEASKNGLKGIAKYIESLSQGKTAIDDGPATAAPNQADELTATPSQADDVVENAAATADDLAAARRLEEIEHLRTQIREVENDKDILTKGRDPQDFGPLGNYREMCARLRFLEKEFVINGRRGTFTQINNVIIRSIDDKGRNGIDAIYAFSNPPPDYIITEIKGIKGSLDKTKKLGKQMSETWLNNYLKRSIDDPAVYRKVMKGKVQNLLINVDNSSKMVMKTLDPVTAGITGKWTPDIL